MTKRPAEHLFANTVTSVALATHSVSLFLFLHMMSIEHRHEDNSSLELFGFAHFAHELLDFWDKLSMLRILGKYSTRIPSVLRRLCPRFCIVMNLCTIPTVAPKQYLMLGSHSSFQDITQNLRICKHLHAGD